MLEDQETCKRRWKTILVQTQNKQKTPNRIEKHNIYDDQTKITNLYTLWRTNRSKKRRKLHEKLQKNKDINIDCKKITKSQKNLKKLTKEGHARQSKTKHKPLHLIPNKPEEKE